MAGVPRQLALAFRGKMKVACAVSAPPCRAYDETTGKSHTNLKAMARLSHGRFEILDLRRQSFVFLEH